MFIPDTAIESESVKQYTKGRNGNEPEGIVFHYSAMDLDALSLAALFAERGNWSASYHFIIGRTGEIVQTVDTDNTAWHVGGGILPGHRRPIPRLANYRTIGVCFTNQGFSKTPFSGSVWHRHPKTKKPLCWDPYTMGQYSSARSLIAILREAHPTIEYVVGHEAMKKTKSDPGPAFSWWNLLSEDPHQLVHRTATYEGSIPQWEKKYYMKGANQC